MTKLLNLLIVLLAVALVAVILYPQIQENRPKVVKFACDSTVSALPVLIGIEEGLFVSNRITPEIVWYSDPDQALADLFAGKCDIGIFPWSTVLKRSAEKGDTLRVYVSQEFRQSLPVDGIVIPAKSKLKTVADLKKRKLGYPPQMRDCVKPLLANLNLPEKEVTTIEFPLSGLVNELRAGRIDAAWLLEPLLCSLDSLEFSVLVAGALPRYVSAPFPGAAMGMSPAYYGLSKVWLSRMKIATDAAVTMSETSVERAKLILNKYFPYCSETYGRCRIPEMQRLVEINKPAVSALAARLFAAGVLPADVETQNLFAEPVRLTR